MYREVFVVVFLIVSVQDAMSDGNETKTTHLVAKNSKTNKTENNDGTAVKSTPTEIKPKNATNTGVGNDKSNETENKSESTETTAKLTDGQNSTIIENSSLPTNETKPNPDLKADNDTPNKTHSSIRTTHNNVSSESTVKLTDGQNSTITVNSSLKANKTNPGTNLGLNNDKYSKTEDKSKTLETPKQVDGQNSTKTIIPSSTASESKPAPDLRAENNTSTKPDSHSGTTGSANNQTNSGQNKTDPVGTTNSTNLNQSTALADLALVTNTASNISATLNENTNKSSNGTNAISIGGKATQAANVDNNISTGLPKWKVVLITLLGATALVCCALLARHAGARVIRSWSRRSDKEHSDVQYLVIRGDHDD